jgi:hypothetical protein
VIFVFQAYMEAHENQALAWWLELTPGFEVQVRPN